MKKIWKGLLIFSVAALGAACGGESGDDAGDAGAAEAAEMEAARADAGGDAPGDMAGGVMEADWIAVDHDGGTVTIELIAGETATNSGWNFNGYLGGETTVVVPEGYEITINFRNDDPVNYHSVAVLDTQATWPPMFNEMVPVFDGAITSNAGSANESTPPGGGSEAVTFTASSAGAYALVCVVPAHAMQGMWLDFEVSADGEAGLR
ncbi:MAG: hypothetical protein J4G03_02285 [Gemmatimonadetes bacterium]|nr:hypothetical protein [Gemmatimonadota bacterium]